MTQYKHSAEGFHENMTLWKKLGSTQYLQSKLHKCTWKLEDQNQTAQNNGKYTQEYMTSKYTQSIAFE